MPLSRPALSLGPGPRGVQNARHWVVEVCNDIGRSDLVECAELGVSELVTNALLHAATPIAVRVRGTREHPRVEVSDAAGNRLPSDSRLVVGAMAADMMKHLSGQPKAQGSRHVDIHGAGHAIYVPYLPASAIDGLSPEHNATADLAFWAATLEHLSAVTE